MKELNYKHFEKLQQRYWKTIPLINPAELVEVFIKEIDKIERSSFGAEEDNYECTTKAKIIFNGSLLKIYYFLKNSIIYIENKEYITAIPLIRLCVEHIVMLSYFKEKLSFYIEKNNLKSLEVLLHSYTMGSRFMYVDAVDKKTNIKSFSTRAEHINEALRAFDKKYGIGVQFSYDEFSEQTHATPTSSVRMFYRQKKWNIDEPKIDFRKQQTLSTSSNSHEKMACGGIEKLVLLYKKIHEDVVNELQETYELLEKKGRLIKIQNDIDPNFYSDIDQIIFKHDEMVDRYLKKLLKYKKF